MVPDTIGIMFFYNYISLVLRNNTTCLIERLNINYYLVTTFFVIVMEDDDFSRLELAISSINTSKYQLCFRFSPLLLQTERQPTLGPI